MQLNKFIQSLQEIENKYGSSAEVLMADGIPVVAPIFLQDFLDSKAVIITDQK